MTEIWGIEKGEDKRHAREFSKQLGPMFATLDFMERPDIFAL